MGTFHRDRGSLHGISVVVDTWGPHVYVGRCDTVAPEGITPVDVDVHEDGEWGRSKEDYLREVARVGHWMKHARVVVPTAEYIPARSDGPERW